MIMSMYSKERVDFLESNFGMMAIARMAERVQNCKDRLAQADVGWEEVLRLRGMVRGLQDAINLLSIGEISENNKQEDAK